MDKREAHVLLCKCLAAYRARPYAALVALIGNTEAVEAIGQSGSKYQIEINVVRDYEPRGCVRVMASIDDGTFRAACWPLTGDFIKAPDETFVGET